MKTTTTKNTPNYSDDMTKEQWAELENYLKVHQELDADDINELIAEMVLNGKTLVIDEKVKDRNDLIAEQAKELETLKAQLADKALIIENLNIEVTELNKAVNNATHELKVEQGKASRQLAWDKRNLERKSRIIDKKKQAIADMEAKIYSQTDIIATFKTQDTMRHEQAEHQAGLIEEMEVTNKALREQNDYLKATLKSVL